MIVDASQALGRSLLRRSRAFRFAVKQRLGLADQPTLKVYPGHVANGRLHLLGRVLEDEGVFDVPHSNSVWRNLWRTFKRYETDEIGGAILRFRGQGVSGTVRSKLDGYFRIDVPWPGEGPWADVDVTLEQAKGYSFEAVTTAGRARVVSPRARFGVISDIDDTIIHTGAFKMLRHWRIVTANSPEARLPFPGVPRFYRALCEGIDGPETNPVFYVSSSPWNLADIFERFMLLRGIPVGPMFLRSLSDDAMGWLLRRHRGHKDEMIDQVMEAYPDLPFLLIGDSGQKDASVYAAAVERHPGRVLAVHLHDVRPAAMRDGRVEAELRRIEARGVPTTLSDTLAGAAEHAEANGLILPGTRAAVEAEIAAEIGKPERFGRFPVIVQP
ncbi:App1 family protein [Aureimonas jatrophae]|uniref:Phosphatidate phosphatase APP1 n=1 Tax=Aureimonas jatrophae TaxID=1166073 RepID=A0A1H0BZZ4_9HYPH|nr:phosphatase domain-containing protein [Aureimonas jatrophae]MBB3949008.1 phosphatidate phosphatase APP1 [Aureimonas jatrophae]SDN51214.1 Phosphatidate phosphatase APP1 [Aureimonas jatrophae]